MNAQKFTQKSLEAIKQAQALVVEYQNMQIDQPHLMAALLKQPEGLAPKLLKKRSLWVRRTENPTTLLTGLSLVTTALLSSLRGRSFTLSAVKREVLFTAFIRSLKNISEFASILQQLKRFPN